MSELSHEKVLKSLVSLGLTRLDAKVYVLLAKRGPIKARDAAKALKISKQRLYPVIKNLQSKGIVNSTLERPARFSAVQFEKVLDSFLKAKMEQTRRIQQNKDELLSDWQSIAIAESASSPAKFTVIEGRSYVYSKIQQMIKDTREKLSFVATVPSLARADQFGLFDTAFNHPSRSKIKFRFLTELSDQNASAMKVLLERIPKANLNIEGKTPGLGLKLCPRMVIKDEAEAMFFIDHKESELASEQDDVCLWTNCKSLVNGFLAMFEDLWHNASDIEKKIVEIETGKPTPKGHIISDARTAYEKYHKALKSAKEEIIITTSAKGLIDYWKDIHPVKQCVERGVQIKIMAPIVSSNVEVVQQLLKLCEVRNISPSYRETTVVDGEQVFQFEDPPPDPEWQKKSETNTYLQNTFHTTNHEYVEKKRNILNNIWKTAYIPSVIPQETVTKMLARAKMNDFAVDSHSNSESIREPEKIVGLTRVRLTLDLTSMMTVDEQARDDVTRVITQSLTLDVELAIEDETTLIGKAIIERKVVVVPQKEGERRIFNDHYVFTFGDGGFEGNALIILENFTPEKFWEKSKAYALFKGTGAFEGRTLNVGHPWQNFGYPIVFTGYLLKP